MALRFAAMIDEAEEKWGFNVVGFLTDNDGGSKKDGSFSASLGRGC
jgi:hypothetical protein